MTTPPDFEARASDIANRIRYLTGGFNYPSREHDACDLIATALTQAYEEGRQQGLQDALPLHQRKPPPFDFSEDQSENEG